MDNFKKLYQLLSYKLNFSAILPTSYIYCNPLFSKRQTNKVLYLLTQHNIITVSKFPTVVYTSNA